MLCVDDAEKAPAKHNGEMMKAMTIMKLGYFLKLEMHLPLILGIC